MEPAHFRIGFLQTSTCITDFQGPAMWRTRRMLEAATGRLLPNRVLLHDRAARGAYIALCQSVPQGQG